MSCEVGLKMGGRFEGAMIATETIVKCQSNQGRKYLGVCGGDRGQP